MSTDRNTPRYLVADEPGGLWGHLFGPGSTETMTRFVYDRDDGSFVTAQARSGDGWSDLDVVHGAELLDSLTDANGEALDGPAAFGLVETDDLPDWAAPSPHAGPARGSR